MDIHQAYLPLDESMLRPMYTRNVLHEYDFSNDQSLQLLKLSMHLVILVTVDQNARQTSQSKTHTEITPSFSAAYVKRQNCQVIGLSGTNVNDI